MEESEATRHRAGKLRQQNKAHKTRTKSKRELKRFLSVTPGDGGGGGGGRARSGSTQSTSSTSKSALNRQERRQKSSDLRKLKRSDVIRRRRQGGGLDAPRVVCIVSLSATVEEPVANFTRSISSSSAQHSEILETQCFPDKSRITFVDTTVERDPVKVLDACKVADIVAFVVGLSSGDSQNEEIEIKSSVSGGLALVLSQSIDERGRELLTLIKAQGMPTPMGLIQGLEKVPSKHRLAAKRNITTFFQQELAGGNDMKVVDLRREMDEYTDTSKALLRSICEVAIKPLTWRAERSYLLALEKVTAPGDQKVVSIRGHLRGRPLSVHQLIHVAGWGNCRLTRISFPKDPVTPRSHGGAGEAMDKEDIVADQSKLPSLKEEAEPDLMGGEQTWPTTEEMIAGEGRNQRREKAQFDGDDRNDNGMDVENDDARSRASSKKTETVDPGKDYLKAWGVDVDEDEAFDFGGPLNKPKQTKQDRAKMDLDFPDEMDTPGDIPARERFERYRGLKSFRTSPWHPTESLPREYGYIHQLKNFKQAQKIVLDENENVEQSWIKSSTLGEDYVQPGAYVELHFETPLDNVDDVVVCAALHQYENCLSLLNCLVQPKEIAEPVESREELELHVGIWRRKVRPIFSEHNLNCDKHKMERFMETGRWTVCSSYAPITFGTNIPVLLFRPRTGELVATGSVLNVDPNRIILKKVVLTGVPFRIKKRWAVVRKMFYSPEDVAWFQPVELYTKYGASGRILESVGTHGSMKCQFDRVITQQDTVCMALYKRVFPKRTEGMFKELGIEDGDDDDDSDVQRQELSEDDDI